MVINTNIEAQRTANNLQASQNRLQKTLSRLSSGSKIVNAADDAAGLAVSSRLESNIRRIGSVLNNLGNAMSLTQTQDGYLKNIDHAMQRMTELAMLAQDNTKQDQDRALYNKEFQQLMDYVLSTRTNDFNGVNLFDGSKVDVVIDPDGNTFPVGGVNLFSSVYDSALKKQSWQLTGNTWQTSKSGYVTDVDSQKILYKSGSEAYKLTSDLWWQGSAWHTSQPTTGTPPAPDPSAVKVSAGSFIATGSMNGNSGLTNLTAPPVANSTKFDPNTMTTADLAASGNGFFEEMPAPPGTATADKIQYSRITKGSFLASDPAGNGDLEYQHRGAVAKGHYITVDPGSQDTDAIAFSSGSTVTTDQDLSDPPFNADNLGGVEIATIEGAKASLDVIFKALDQLHLDRASLGAIQQRVEFTSGQLITSNQNLTQAKSRITDVDVAAETTEFAKHQILVQSGTQMLRQANSLPQTALELLR
ncbi:MAG: flagellin [Verrucomicrobiota bacterium]|jgi:flagellin|nr:flagellin [Verrucomicrobiota bacterium]